MSSFDIVHQSRVVGNLCMFDRMSRTASELVAACALSVHAAGVAASTLFAVFNSAFQPVYHASLWLRTGGARR